MKKRGVYIDPLWMAFLLLGLVLGALLMCVLPEMMLPAQAVETQAGETITVKSAEDILVKREICYEAKPTEETAEEPEAAPVQMREEPAVADAFSAMTTTVSKMEIVMEDPLESMGLFKVTAYCPCRKCCGKEPGDPWYGITATGTKATEGRTIAVDPKVIGYGSVVYFEGVDGLETGYVAEDCGGAIKGNEIDLYFDSHEDALEWGVRELEVFTYR